MSAEFRKGDRVKFTHLWMRNYHVKQAKELEKRGTVTSTPQQSKHNVNVKWDGIKSTSSYHQSFIERLP